MITDRSWNHNLDLKELAKQPMDEQTKKIAKLSFDIDENSRLIPYSDFDQEAFARYLIQSVLKQTLLQNRVAYYCEEYNYFRFNYSKPTIMDEINLIRLKGEYFERYIDLGPLSFLKGVKAFVSDFLVQTRLKEKFVQIPLNYRSFVRWAESDKASKVASLLSKRRKMVASESEEDIVVMTISDYQKQCAELQRDVKIKDFTISLAKGTILAMKGKFFYKHRKKELGKAKELAIGS